MNDLAHFHQQVRPEWIDYNGHLNEGYYAVVFGYATDALMDRIGLDGDYRQRTRCSLYTVESHIRYLREVAPDSHLTIISRIVGHAAKKLRLCHEMEVEGVLVATEEVMTLHVDGEQGRTTPFPEEIAERIAGLAETPPDYAGRSIG